MKIRKLDLNGDPANVEHRELGLPPLEENITHPPTHPVLIGAAWFAFLVLITLGGYLLIRLFVPGNWQGGMQIVGETLSSSAFWSAAAVGFIAQTVDGALGMAYGLTATTFLLSTGATPAMASASVHIAEVFTTGFSGISHVRFGNVNKKLFLRLLLPGITGAVLGAIVVTQVDGRVIKPYVSAYLLIMGVYVLSKAWRRIQIVRHEPRHVAKLALFGGFVDAAGGGGWGPVVTTTLVSSGHDPRTTIGSVNFAEFFLTLSGAAAFTLLVESTAWVLVAGLVFGGIFSAPLAAILCRKLRARSLLILVGTLISALSIYNLYKAFTG
jgi:uncharacterized protein